MQFARDGGDRVGARRMTTKKNAISPWAADSGIPACPGRTNKNELIKSWLPQNRWRNEAPWTHTMAPRAFPACHPGLYVYAYAYAFARKMQFFRPRGNAYSPPITSGAILDKRSPSPAPGEFRWKGGRDRSPTVVFPPWIRLRIRRVFRVGFRVVFPGYAHNAVRWPLFRRWSQDRMFIRIPGRRISNLRFPLEGKGDFLSSRRLFPWEKHVSDVRVVKLYRIAATELANYLNKLLNFHGWRCATEIPQKDRKMRGDKNIRRGNVISRDESLRKRHVLDATQTDRNNREQIKLRFTSRARNSLRTHENCMENKLRGPGKTRNYPRCTRAARIHRS